MLAYLQIVFARPRGHECAPKCEVSCVGLACVSHFSWNFNCIDCLVVVLVSLLHDLLALRELSQVALNVIDHEVANWSNCCGVGLSRNSKTWFLQYSSCAF